MTILMQEQPTAQRMRRGRATTAAERAIRREVAILVAGREMTPAQAALALGWTEEKYDSRMSEHSDWTVSDLWEIAAAFGGTREGARALLLRICEASEDALQGHRRARPIRRATSSRPLRREVGVDDRLQALDQ